jgi:DNA-directed RNA polymerase alpha subunit
MSRLTLRLPATLHQQLAHLADSEGVSLNQYIVYALTRQTNSSYAISIIPEVAVRQQQKEFQLSIEQLGKASAEEIESVLAQRERVELEPELSTSVVAQLKERIRLSKLAT